MRTAEEILRKGVQASGLYFDNNGNRMILVSEAEKAIKEAHKEVIEYTAKVSEMSILSLIHILK